MRNPAKIISSFASVAAILGTLAFVPATATAAEASVVEEGKKIAFDRRKGNCLACHMVEGGDLPGNIGPPLVAMKARFPDKATLRAQIWDARRMNPNTIMPPFGAHRILTEEEIDKVVEFIHTL
jgi:sulfur-oxidizing protein SoxX